MSKAAVFRNLLVGIAFLASLGVLGYATLKVSDLSWIRGEAHALDVRFDDVNQLVPGQHAVMHGVRIGQVESIVYDPQTNSEFPVLVRVNLRRQIPVSRTTTFQVRSAGPLGGRYLEIDPLAGGVVDPAIVPDDQVYVGKSSGDLFQQLGKLIEDNEGRIGDILKGLKELVDEMRTGQGILPSAIRDQEMAADFRQLLTNFNEAGASIKTTFDAINNQDGPAGWFVNNSEGRDKLEQVINDIAAMTSAAREEESIVRMLFFDKEAKDELRDVVTDLREISRSAREGPGTLSMVLNDEDFSRRVKDIVDAASEILVKINRGEGTLGQLVNNREVWDELRRILVQAREALEDLREQAPIRTFVNAIFATF